MLVCQLDDGAAAQQATGTKQLQADGRVCAGALRATRRHRHLVPHLPRKQQWAPGVGSGAGFNTR